MQVLRMHIGAYTKWSLRHHKSISDAQTGGCKQWCDNLGHTSSRLFVIGNLPSTTLIQLHQHHNIKYCLNIFSALPCPIQREFLPRLEFPKVWEVWSAREVLVNFDKYSWGNICELLAEYLSFVWKIFVAESDLRSACKSGSLVTGYLQMIVDSTMPTIRRRTPSCQREEMPNWPKHNWQSAHETL